MIALVATGSAPTPEEISAATSSPTSTSATSARWAFRILCDLHKLPLLDPISPSLNLAKPSGGTSWQDICWTGSTWTKISLARPPSFQIHNKTKKEVEKHDTRLTRTATTFNEDSSKDGGDQKDQCKLGRGQQNKKTQDVQNQYSLNPSSWSVTLPLQSTSVTKLVT